MNTGFSSRKRITIGEIRSLIRSEFQRLQLEAYDKDLIDDESFNDDSVLVPDDIKDSIKKWVRVMGLSNGKHLSKRIDYNT